MRNTSDLLSLASSKSVYAATGVTLSGGDIVEAKGRQRIRVGVQLVGLTNCGDGAVQIIRQRGTKIQLLARNRMVELKPCCVQEMPFRCQSRQPPPTTSTIRVVTNNRVANRGEMHPDLVCPSRMQMRAQKVSTGEPRKPAKIRACVLPCTDDCHPLPVSRISCNWLVHR